MKVLVTGGGGFLGRAVVEQLLAGGHAVTVVGRSEYPEVAALGARTVRADVSDRARLTEAVHGHDAVVHTAGKAGVWGSAEEFERTNVAGTEAVLDACRAAGVSRLVHTSSPSVVFDGTDHEGVAERPYPDRYEAAYPRTKAKGERAVLAADGPGLATVALRPHLIYGPRDPHLLPRVFARARAGRLRIVGDGRNRVSVTYVDNAAAAHVQALEALAPGAPCAGRAYFVNDPEPVELWPWLNGLLEKVGLPPVRRRVSTRLARVAGTIAEAVWSTLPLPGEPPMTRFVAAQLGASHWYATTPATRDFGYVPPIAAAEALGRTVAYWRPRVHGR